METRKRTAEEVDGLLGSLESGASAVQGSATTGEPEIKKQRSGKKTAYAMLLSYQGASYFGMQIQKEEFPTIESHILDAMLKHGFITEEQRKDVYSWYFQRCARTDRGVSAVRQICSMKLRRDDRFLNDGTKLLNGSLPEDIRVIGIKRTAPSFHAQKYCDGRTYSYTLPTFAFAACDELTTDAYRITPERIAEIDELLDVFIGAHNFFNYTSKLEHQDPRCYRNIISFKCDQPFLYMDPVRNREVEFITLYVHGNSFMMHQIRKMIGALLAIVRGFMYKSDIVRSFQADRMDIPKAPGLGLLLEKMHFGRYERRFAKTHGSLNDWGDEIERNVLEARDRLIIARMLREECETQSMMKWLTTLPLHLFLVDPEDETCQNVSICLSLAAKNANYARRADEEEEPDEEANCEEENAEEESREVGDLEEALEEANGCPAEELNEELLEEKKQAIAR